MATTPIEQQHPTPGPMRLSGAVSRIVAADATLLYHRVADVTRTPEWSRETRRCHWLDGATAARVGARFLGHNTWGVLRWSRLCEVVVTEPGREFTFRTVPSGERGDSTRWTFRFEPAEGGTRVTHAYEIVRRLPPATERLAAVLLRHHRDRRPDMARSLERIADAAEGRDRVRQPHLGQAHTAEGPLDLSAMYVMHHGFRRDLRDFALTVPATPLADTQAWAALAQRWNGFAMALHHHHRVEDISIWPPLLNRIDAANDAAGRDTLQAMQVEHTAFDPLIQACTERFQTMASAPDAATRDGLAADVVRIRHALIDHLNHEESGALPLIQQHLSTAAWTNSEIAARKEFGLAHLGFTVPWAAHEVPHDQFAIAFAHGGPTIRAILTLTWRRFLNNQRVAFRHRPSGT
jgi:hypothetical protein